MKIFELKFLLKILDFSNREKNQWKISASKLNISLK